MIKILNKMKGLLIALLILIPINGLAAEKNPDDLPARTYIIGTHEFSPGTAMTTQRIMWAGRTIAGKEIKIEDMIILYKNIDNEWVETVSKKTIEPTKLPKTIFIEYKDEVLLEDIKTNNVDALISAYNSYKETDYTTTSWNTLTSFFNNGKAAIKVATTTDIIDKAKQTAIDGMKSVKTIQQQLQQLQEAKTTKKNAADALLTELTQDDYTVASWTVLTEAIAADKVAIDALETVEAVEGYTLTATAAKAALVTKVLISAITVTGEGPVVNGKTLQMGVVIGPDNASNKKVTWFVTNDEGSATIDANGLLTATGVGKVTVKAVAQDGSGKENTKEITITPSDADKVAIAKSNLDLGDLSAVTSDLTLPTIQDDATVVWASNNTAVIANDGTVTRPAFTEGDATVTLTATITSGTASDTKEFAVTVIKAEETDAEKLTKAKANLSLGDISAIVENMTLPTTQNDATVSWASDTEGVISTTGTVTRPESGTEDVTVTLTATLSLGSETATKAFTVIVKAKAATQHTLTLTGDNISSTPGAGKIDDGTEVTVTVTPTTGKQVATFTVGGVDKKADLVENVYTFNITAATTVAVTYKDIKVTEVTLDKTTLNLTAGGATVTLTAIVNPSDATNKAVTWSSDNTTVATVADGVVTPLSAGTATITVTTEDGSKKAMCDITVAAESFTLIYTAGTGGTITGTSPQTVSSGGDGTLVTATPDVGYSFVKWSDDFATAERTDTNVTTNITVEAEFKINEYTVVFKDYDGTDLETQTVKHGLAATAPTDPTREGYTFAGWDKGFTSVTGDLTITAQYTKDIVPVTNIAGVPTNGTVGSEIDLTVASVAPADATNKTIVWSVKDAGTTEVTAGDLSTGKFTPSAAGTLQLTATITNGLTESSDYTQDFTITIAAAGTQADSFTATLANVSATIDTEVTKADLDAGITNLPSDASTDAAAFTPDAKGDVTKDIVITFLDGSKKTVMVTVKVERIKITEVKATSLNFGPPVFGEQANTLANLPKFTISEGSPAYFNTNNTSNAHWMKKDGDDFKKYGSEPFTAGTYYFRCQVRIDDKVFDGKDGTTHKLASPLKVMVGEDVWLENGTPSVSDEYSYVWVSSPKYVITAPAYASTNTLANSTVTIANGTSKTDAIAALDSTVGVVGTKGETGTATIAWTIASYNGSTAGNYTATGVLTLPTGWTGTAGNVTATVTVNAAIPPAYSSTNALANSTVTVANGTSEADAKAALDATVGVVGTNSESGTATIAWTIASYNGSTAGNYTATGVLTLPTGWTGTAGNVTATVTVNAAIDTESDATLTSTTYTLSCSGTNSETITNVPYATDQTVFKNSLLKKQLGQTIEYNLNYPVKTGDTVVVKSSDGTQTVTYTITVNASQLTDAVLTSAQYTVSANGTANETITNVPYGTIRDYVFANALNFNSSHLTRNMEGVSYTVKTGDTVVITASDGIAQVTYTVTVNPPSTDAEKVTEAKGNLTLGDISAVVADMSLPLTQDDATVSWVSDRPSVIANDGKVTRPAYLSGDATVKLTATITVGSETQTKVFTVTVMKADPITASISNVVATNGTVTITLDKKPSVEPIADDFTATSKIDSGVANTLELAGFNYDDNVTVTYNFTPVVKTDVVQNVVVAVTYNLFEKVAPAFEVEANVGVTETPVITGPVRGGDTSVSGTAVDGATVVLSVNASAKPGVIATGGNWTVSELTLVENDVIKVTAILEPNTISSEATTTVLAAPDFALGSGTEVNPYQVSSAEELNKVRNHLDKHFKQTADINLSTYTTDGGWQPIGDSTIPFTGTYDGNNFKISNLTINRPDAKEQGLFGSTASAKVENCRISGSVKGKNYVGGLVGYNYSGTISKSYSSVAVQGVSSVGGLVGANQGPDDGTDNGIIENSYASGTVIGEKFTGGLVGVCQEGNITNSYATGLVTGGESNKGGLTGARFTSSITSSYYDIETTNQPVVSGNPTGIGKTTAEMKQADTFVGWDPTIWNITNGSYPTLK